MKILFLADARSPIALNWIRFFTESGEHEIHLVSSFPADPIPGLASFHVVPTAFSGAATAPASTRGSLLRRLTSPRVRTLIRQWLGGFTVKTSARNLAEIIAQVSPDLIHAMRIPYEGMVAAEAYSRPGSAGVASPPPLLVSIWGNDFTLHAAANFMMARRTRQVLSMADAIHADCERDIRLADSWGFDNDKPRIVLPGAGGIQTDLFYPAATSTEDPLTVVMPRGMRAYVCGEAFFRAVPLVLAVHAETRFACPALAGESAAEDWVRTLGISANVDLLPKMPREAMAGLFRRSAVMVSPTIHDGTPNTLLEALACGCFPVAGDIESIREWITDGETGYLVDPARPESIADAICRAIENPKLREQAKSRNLDTIRRRASYKTVMEIAQNFYSELTT